MDLNEIRPAGALRSAGLDDLVQVYTYDPNSRAGYPLFVLMEKEAPFNYIYVDLFAFEEGDPAFLSVNPEGAVPAVVHKGQLFNDSVFMCEYLNTVIPGPSLVPEADNLLYLMRERCRQSDDAAQSVSMYAWNRIIRPTLKDLPRNELEQLIARNPTEERRVAFRRAAIDGFTTEQVDNARNKILTYVHELNAALTGREWLVGDAFSLADIITFANFYAVTENLVDEVTDTTVPNFMSWLRRCFQRPTLMATMGLGRTLSLRAFDIAKKLDVTNEGAGNV